MSSDDEDDYLSAKFLSEPSAASSSSSRPKTYSDIRKDAQKRSQLRQEQNRVKSRKERELESREEGLSKSLFERAKEEEEAGLTKNKALNMMMKMGFKPGQSLGAQSTSNDEGVRTTKKQDVEEEDTAVDGGEVRRGLGVSTSGLGFERISNAAHPTKEASEPSSNAPAFTKPHLVEPLPILEWQGKQGIGLGKRARSPEAEERMAKMAKLVEQADHRDFRERAREEYNNRKADGRLGPVQRTCATLDEGLGKEFNVLWLNPNNENSFPPGLIEALALHGNTAAAPPAVPGASSSVSTAAALASHKERLRAQMRAEALAPLNGPDGDEEGADDDAKLRREKEVVSAIDQWDPHMLEEATQFLRLQAQDRLHLVLSYLRDKHHYCFWCGIKYDDAEDMEKQCPGTEEDDHD